MPWWTLLPGGREAEEQTHQALTHYNQLQSNIAASIAAAQQNQWDPRTLTDALLALQSNASGLGRYLSYHCDPKFYNERRLPESTIASQVLLVPELLELILVHLHFHNILNVSATCHGIRDVVDASPRLLPNLFLKPMPVPKENCRQTCRFQTPFGRGVVSNFNVWVRDHETVVAREVMAEIHYIDEPSAVLKVNPKWRKMLICQPPPERMSVVVACRMHLDTFYDNVVRDVSNPTGLTVGDLYSKAEEILQGSSPCWRCASIQAGGHDYNCRETVAFVQFEGDFTHRYEVEHVSWVL